MGSDQMKYCEEQGGQKTNSVEFDHLPEDIRLFQYFVQPLTYSRKLCYSKRMAEESQEPLPNL